MRLIPPVTFNSWKLMRDFFSPLPLFPPVQILTGLTPPAGNRKKAKEFEQEETELTEGFQGGDAIGRPVQSLTN
jgi:hypothetical protein